MDDPTGLDDPTAFPNLSDAEMAALDAVGSRRAVTAGEYLYREGDPSYDFFAIVSGRVEAVVTEDGSERVIVCHGPGRFLGELNLLTGLRVFVSAVVVEDGEVIVVDRATLRRLIAAGQPLGDKILAAYLARRTLLVTDAAASVRVIGSRFSPASMQVREFLARLRVPHQWLDVESHPDVEGALQGVSVEPDDLPVVIAPGKVLRRATPGEVSDYLGLTLSRLPDRCFDLIVVGGGPAGLAAVVYGASEGLRTLGLEMTVVGGQAGSSSRIENYLGFPLGVSGADLTLAAVIQAEKFGAELSIPCTATQLEERAG
ncbi:MAG TPA: cyclic nucleotide-binding domain-containing protein, partial [Actinomycetota bacterium]|nr:cyclic nucleotide-binding domain-containing protein [Actinomycetota bacterium]